MGGKIYAKTNRPIVIQIPLYIYIVHLMISYMIYQITVIYINIVHLMISYIIYQITVIYINIVHLMISDII